MVKYVITNPEDIPENLPPGTYDTRIVSCKYEPDGLVLKVKFLGTAYNKENPQSLVQMTKEDTSNE